GQFIIVIFFLKYTGVSAQQDFFQFSDSCIEINSRRNLKYMTSSACWRSLHQPEPDLDSLYSFLNRKNNVMVELAFHTDTRGSERYNLMFSQRVMDYLKATLVEKGIDSLRIISRGYGERFPVIPPE